MPSPEPLLLIFVHGWSVTHTNTYGELPARLARELAGDTAVDTAHLYLGKYVSFRDEVRLADLSRGFEAALRELLATRRPPARIACITHSTGGPVVRDWLDRYYVQPKKLDACPLSHLVLLAPANFGSALAQLGKSRLGHMKAGFGGVEPGTGVLDWLELGSGEAYLLNHRWINDYPDLTAAARPIFPFVLTGDAVDRKLYDYVNAYTCESGSDGVVRVAAANLNAGHLRLQQPAVRPGEDVSAAKKRLARLELAWQRRTPATAFKIVPGVAHSGTAMGIMRSVRDDGAPHTAADAIVRCLRVVDRAGYQALRRAFDAENAEHQRPDNRIDTQKIAMLPDREYIHDPHAMVIFRLFDDAGQPVTDVDLLLTAGPRNSPDHLPRGFLSDRQANRRAPNTLTFFLNHAALVGCPPIVRKGGTVARGALPTFGPYGIVLRPRETRGRYVERWECGLRADTADLLQHIRANETTIVDIVLHRVVREGVFRLTSQLAPADFKNAPLGAAIP